jgi:hypothetical protein
MRTRLITLTGFALFIAVSTLMTGCQSKQADTQTMGDPLTAAQPVEEDKGLAGLLPWNWFEHQEKPITKGDVLGNMSPELSTTARTPDETDIQISRSVDTTTRQAWDDLLGVFFLDRPSRLSLYPVP